ncbi:hypothetical protein B0I35DRAFT_382465 [Stachybotrys elegans]|uniref:Rhodopsin domain-containing protein n=1 Tax=Stachybotrys elegans TaxID=80388 RepID=A0A8K0SJH3_9HYPO|nr:hypothetical protein B0I35DRAFT_382465 [Stachybotrys elegans]
MAEERGTRLIVSCWSLALLSGVLLFLRTYCKLWRGRGLWWDDHLLIAAWVCLSISVSINTYIVSLGFGSHIDTISAENLKTINLNTIMVAAFGIMATTLSKTSFAVTLYRLTTSRWMKFTLIFIIITINISLNLVWIFGLTKCTPFERVVDANAPGTCWDRTKLVKFQLFAAYYSAALDFVLAFLPWQILMGMSMLRRERLGVAIAMSLGAIAGATAIVKSVLVVNMTSLDFTYDRVDLTIWTLAEPAVSIMAISIPILRMLYREIKSSNRSYFRNISKSNGPEGKSGGNTESGTTFRKSIRNGGFSKYGQNSVVIMSTTGWQDSEEALQDPKGSGNRTPLGHGVMKTEEVTINYENSSMTSGEDSIEMAPLPAVYTRDGKRPSEEQIKHSS